MDVRFIASIINEDIDFHHKIDPDLIRMLADPRVVGIIKSIRDEVELADKKSGLRRLLMNSGDKDEMMVKMISATRNHQCVSIPNSDEDIGSTYLEQQIGGIITRLWPTDVQTANIARHVFGMEPSKPKSRQQQASIAVRQNKRKQKRMRDKLAKAKKTFS